MGQLGVTPSYTTIDIAKFETIIRTYMDNIVPRLMMILDPIPVILENLPDDFLQEITLFRQETIDYNFSAIDRVKGISP